MSAITVRGARLHNLKNVTLAVPKNQMVVFCGVSGSGKSTMAFDILHKESLRQYLESIGMVPYALTKPPIDGITGLSPTISVEQGLTNHSPRSTVGTATEVFSYLRLLYARIGHRPCPRCGGDVPPAHEGEAAISWEEEIDELPELEGEATADKSATDKSASGKPAPDKPAGEKSAIDKAAPDRSARDKPGGDKEADATEPGVYGDYGEEGEWVQCPHCGARLPELNMGLFSFNKPGGACPTCTGLGTVYTPDLKQVLDEEKSIEEGAVLGWDKVHLVPYHSTTLRRAAQHYGFPFDPAQPVRELVPAARDLLLYGVGDPRFQRHFPGIEPPATVNKGRFEGVVTALLRRHAEHAADADYREKSERVLIQRTCPDCDGARLRPEMRAVTVAGRPLVSGESEKDREPVAAARLSLQALLEWTTGLQAVLGDDDWLVAEPVVRDLHVRVERLVEVGLGYLTPEQGTPSLSAGEAQRLRLAQLLGSGLTGVLYILDEPTIGLHPRDTPRLIRMLKALRDLENTVLVIEHDLEMIAAADWVVDFGPGGGRYGGQVTAEGTPAQVASNPQSATGRYLGGVAEIPLPPQRRRSEGPYLTVHGAREHNLRNITVQFPLRANDGRSGMLVAVSGVSGSGKSTLMYDILDRAARQRFFGASTAPGVHDAIDGWEHVDKIITIDQAPLGRTARSNAATYSEAFTAIREAFAAQPEARARGLSREHFSFNVAGGRCDRCEGAGVLAVEMHFLPDVAVRCPTCHGRRYKREVLAVKYGGYDISQVLEMTIAEALALFQDVPAARARLALMDETGLGYLQLGQPASSFSGGEAQRVKLARELGRRGAGRTLYLLDEPTTGLHPADTARLLALLQRLVDAGNTVMVIEHNLDVIKVADWVIDLGPEGGAAGGQVIAAGTPEMVAEAKGSYTGELLRACLNLDS